MNHVPTGRRRGAVAARWLVVVASCLVVAVVGWIIIAGSSNAPTPTSINIDIAAELPAPTPAPRVTTPAASAAPVLAPAPPTRGAWTGLVIDHAEGTPIRDALIDLSLVPTNLATHLRDGDVIEVGSTVSDVDGRFAINLPERADRARTLVLRVRAADHASVRYRLATRPRNGTVIRLVPGATARGLTVDSDDKPVREARVTLIATSNDIPPLSDGTPGYCEIDAVSNALGEVLLEGVPSGPVPRFLAASAAGYLSAHVQLQSVETPFRLVMLRGAASIHGIVRDAAGEPVADAVVMAGQIHLPGRPMVSAPPTRTDAGGRYELRGLIAGEWHLNARPAASPANSPSAQARVTLADEARVQQDLQFPALRTITGRAVVADTGTGFSGLEVSSSHMAEAGNAATRAGDVGWAVSGADGSFSLQVPDRAPSFLYFAAPTGWLIAHEDIRDGVLFQQQLPTEPLEIPLRRGHLLRGRVLEPDGTTPAAGTRVTAGSAPPIVHNWGTAVARPDGTFEITVLAEVPGQLRAENPFGFGVADFTMPADGALEPVTIKLAALLALGGRVLDPDGSPVAGARVEAQGYPAGATNRFNRHEATTNERGVYTLEGIRPGRVVLVAHPPAGSDLARSAALDKEVALGGQYLDVDLTLAHSEEIEGLVVDGAGNPIEGATISWNRAITPAGVYTPTQPVTSDAAGRFRLTGLAAGERIEWLSASKEGYASASRMNYNALDGELRLVLEPGSLVVLTARDAATGQPITDYEYLVYAHAWTEYADGSPTRVTNAEGRAELAVTGQGGKRIVVAEIGPDGRHTGRRGVARFTMRPGTIEVTAEVTGTRSVEGVVLDAQSREPIAGVFVEVSSNNQYGGRQTRRSPPGFAVEGSESDAQGRFRITGLVEGSYEIAASRLPVGRIITPPVEFEIERGIEPEPLEVLIGGGAAIVGRAIGADGKPMRGARIMMYHTRGQGGGTHNRTTDRNGNFELRPAVPGVWSVMLLSDATNGTAETRQVEVTGAGDAIVLFDFTGAVEVTGTVLVNGSPINSGELWGTFNRDDSRESRPIQPGPGGRYRALLQPGTHTITFSSRELQGMVVGRLEVPPGAPLRHDINLQLATLDIVLEAPGGAAVPAGNLAITAGANAAMRVFIEEGANRRHLPQIPAGVYTIEYTSRNGLLAGSESGVRVVVGQINAILIVVGEATGERAQLARAQQQLTDLGFDPGPVDGLMGPMTAGALRAFQQSRGLNPTGQLDESTRRALAAPAP